MVQFVYPIWVRKIVEVEAVTSARSGDSESSSRHLAALTIESSTGKSADAAAMVHRRVIAIPPSRVQRRVPRLRHKTGTTDPSHVMKNTSVSFFF